MTLAAPLAPNLSQLTPVSAIAFTFSDGVQTITNRAPLDPGSLTPAFSTDLTGAITGWEVVLVTDIGLIVTTNRQLPFPRVADVGQVPGPSASNTAESTAPRPVVDRGLGGGHGVYPIIDDADTYGVGCIGPAVPADFEGAYMNIRARTALRKATAIFSQGPGGERLGVAAQLRETDV